MAIGVTACVSVASQSLDEIVVKNIEARGGIEKLRAVQTVKMTVPGTATCRRARRYPARGLMTMTIWTKRPNMVRRETTFQIGPFCRVRWHDRMGARQHGREGAADNGPAGGADPARATSIRCSSTTRREATIELVGKEKIDGQAVHHLRVTRKNGKVSQYFISADTGLEVRIVDTFEQGGMKMEVRTDLSNYQTVDGMRLPFTIKQFSNGTLAVEFNLEKVEFNAAVDDEMFRLK